MILLFSFASFLVCIVYWTVTFVRHRSRLTKPIRYVPGPKPNHFLYGNVKDLWNAKPDPMALFSSWVEQYGSVMKYRVLLDIQILIITDLKALNHILSNSFEYEKPEPARWSLARIVGHGLIVAEGEMHKQQRRIMNPAFGAAQIRELTDIFIDKSIQLRDRWQAFADARPGEKVRIDALSWLSRATLDIIGLAGFNYTFDALNPTEKPNELNEAFSTVFRVSEKAELADFVQSRFRILRRLPPLSAHQAAIARARQLMQRVGQQLLNESRTALLGTGEKGDNWRARDLLSLLLRANMGSDLDDSQRMTDFDVLSQIATFLVAGHETTSTATTWALHILSNDIRVQTKLREELVAVPTDSPSMDELNALPYLDQVVREVLRLQPPVAASMRTAVKDSVIPLDKPWTDTQGSVHDTIRVAKGQPLSIPIQILNNAKWLWGEDADQFKPERWSAVPPAAAAIPGVWSHILTFLAGNRSCIGVKFAVIEMKALLFTIVRAFEFEPAVPAEDVGKHMAVVTRPFLHSEPHAGNQLPVYIKPVRADLS